MKSPFINQQRVPFEEEAKPQPTPFPIQIVSDQKMESSSDNAVQGSESAQNKKRSDYVYDVWDKFLCQLPERKSSIAKKIQKEKETVEQTPGDGLQYEENAFTSWEQAKSECEAKVAAIVEECTRLNQKYRDPMFDLATDPYCIITLDGRDPEVTESLDFPTEVKRVSDIFDKPQFFIDGAAATDVHQGRDGDCWFLAALMAISAKKTELIEKTLCVAREEKVGVYGFVFFRDGEWIYEVIDDNLYLRVGDADKLDLVRNWDREGKLGMPIEHEADKLKNQLQRSGQALYFSHCKSDETWVPLIEKAYAKAHGDYTAIDGGHPSEGIEDLTGGVGVVINPEDIMDKNRFWKEQLLQVNDKYLFGGSTKEDSEKGVIASHAYAVLEAWEEGDLRLVKVRNPWGDGEWTGDWSDGSAKWTVEMMQKLNHTFGDDGVFWMSYEHFRNINRVRLFSKEWQVAQCWTCVNVPWAVDYLDTKFQFSIGEPCSVVIVLSQPDDRSVSAEMNNLEAGTYNVVVKVTAYRSSSASTAEEVIMKYAVEQKEKLLAVGRRFDYAQSKGNLRAMEEFNKKSERGERRNLRKALLKKERKITKLEKTQERRRKRRVDEVMREKRRAFAEEQKEKAKLKRERLAERQKAASIEKHAEGRSEETGESKVEDTPETDGSPTTDKGDSQPRESKEEDGKGQTEEGKEGEGEDVKANSGEGEAQLNVDKSDPETLPESFSKLALDKTPSSSDSSEIPPEDDEYESPAEPPEEVDDNDFDWDSEIDDPVNSSDDEDDASALRPAAVKNAMFPEDPWIAMCVLGLRVYAENAAAKVTVIKGNNGS